MSNSILLWYLMAMDANRVSLTSGQGELLGPTLSSRAPAIVHQTMYYALAGATTPKKWRRAEWDDNDLLQGILVGRHPL